ncbi:MAG TPA: FecR domain-containing protein [Chitinophagaceae bacterium]
MNHHFYHITDDLLVKHLLGEASPGERVQVEEWLAASDANRAYYAQLQKVWESSKTLASAREVDEEAAWQRFRTRIYNTGNGKGERHPVHSIGWWRIAALFVVIFGIAFFAYTWLTAEAPVQQLSLQTVDQPLSDTLSDGSVVMLNKHSTITYPSRFKGDTRSITLRGEAFFEVTPNKEQPFVVQVNEVTIKVVGTSFNVRSEGGETEVIVETGVVQVTRGGKTVELRAREKVMVQPNDTALVKETETEALYNYYRTREFVCDNTPLWKLVEVLNEAYGANIVIDRPGLRHLPLTTTFNDESLDHILEVIAITFQITVTREGDSIRLR